MQALTSTPKIESFSIFYAAFDYIVKSIDSRPLQKNLNSVVIKTRSHIGILTYLQLQSLCIQQSRAKRTDLGPMNQSESTVIKKTVPFVTIVECPQFIVDNPTYVPQITIHTVQKKKTFPNYGEKQQALLILVTFSSPLKNLCSIISAEILT